MIVETLSPPLPPAAPAPAERGTISPPPARHFLPDPTDETVVIDQREFLHIRQVDHLPPFLMSVVSDSDVWLFAGSNAGFTAGRVDPDQALFPYQTADRILASPTAAGVRTLIHTGKHLWQPWSEGRASSDISRNLYKHIDGTSLLFEEIHHSLELRLRWEIAPSARFGLLRRCQLLNTGTRPIELNLLDGWHHLLPPGIGQDTYTRYSYLANAYMRHEALPDRRLAIHTLNARVTDRPEPAESLRAACTWSLGLENATLLISPHQIDTFRAGSLPRPETESRGTPGCHLLATRLLLEPGETRLWHHIADTRLDHARLQALHDQLAHPAPLHAELEAEWNNLHLSLRRRIAGAGALQQSADRRATIHHFANVLFNCMRGGTLHDHYRFPREDFSRFLLSRNTALHQAHAPWLATLPDPCTLDELHTAALTLGDAQLQRIAGEYLPLCFSRRHGDPSRPWNRFAIHTCDESGAPLLTYAGNWRDIFQNWESLAYSYPRCFGPMIAIFLNASTADGYNPYRITRQGIDWEIHDPADPWSHIGYWGDHQIVYLLRLLLGMERHQPGEITRQLGHRRHGYAHVPYTLADFDELLRDPKHSIHFDQARHETLLARAASLGGDGKLLTGPDGEILLVTLAEKLLLPLLVKLSNLVPAGGIWLNTQRPEWNDANNALAGWGLSVVTVCHLRRYVHFLESIFTPSSTPDFELTRPVATLLRDIHSLLPQIIEITANGDEAQRLDALSALGRAGETHRRSLRAGPPFETSRLPTPEILALLEAARLTLDATLETNRRGDGMFHSYNLLEITPHGAAIRRLDLMLEGQVAALSSGKLSAAEAIPLLDSLRNSPLYRPDQHSYLLYPDRSIRPFLERNTLPDSWPERIPTLAAQARAGDRQWLRIDAHGRAHFHPDFTKARDLQNHLDSLPPHARPSPQEFAALLELWEETFHHHAFTGRSGAMFGFEGLGSIYWHMVAKLLLAVQEIHFQAHAEGAPPAQIARLAAAYREIRVGLGFTKDPATYGAFPTDPYSHTPAHTGAQQPGMTGQVKEEILTRMGELGVHVHHGRIRFEPSLLDPAEFLSQPFTFEWLALDGSPRSWPLGPHSLAFTCCQVPVAYTRGPTASITIEQENGSRLTLPGNTLPGDLSQSLFQRDGRIRSILVTLAPSSNPPQS
jgi:hypothetical protein